MEQIPQSLGHPEGEFCGEGAVEKPHRKKGLRGENPIRKRGSGGTAQPHPTPLTPHCHRTLWGSSRGGSVPPIPPTPLGCGVFLSG